MSEEKFDPIYQVVSDFENGMFTKDHAVKIINAHILRRDKQMRKIGFDGAREGVDCNGVHSHEGVGSEIVFEHDVFEDFEKSLEEKE